MAKVIADIASKGHTPCVPLSEHQSYDLVAVLMSGECIKLQVKYAQLRKDGTVDIKFRSCWTDKNGLHIKRYSEDDFDYYAIFCPEKDIVLYVPNGSNCPKRVRFEKPLNNQKKGIKWADTYSELPGGASETTRRTPETVKT